MSFYRKYELERLVQKTEPKTFRAREVSGGRAVYLHMLGGLDATARAGLLQRAHALMAAGNAAILDIDDSEFAPYVVTGVIEHFDGLPAWLDNLPVTPGQAPAAPSARPSAAPMPPAVASAPPTETFHQRPPVRSVPPAPPRVSAPPVARSAPPPAPVIPPAASAMPSASEPGEFTRMFAGSGPAPAAPPAQPAASSRPPAPPPVMPPAAASPVMPPAAASGGSEFSKLFGSGPLGSAPPAAEEPGEFSRIFGAPPPMPADNPAGFAPPPVVRPRAPEAPLPWEPQPAAAAQPPPLPAAAPPQMAASQRPRVETPDTQRMQALASPPAQPRAPAVPSPDLDQSASLWNAPAPLPSQQNRPGNSGPGEFTRFFDSPMASSALPIEEIEQGRMPEARASADKPFEGPGEFTRWFGRSSGPADQSGSSPAPPPQAPVQQHNTFLGRATGLFEMPQIPSPSANPATPKGPSEYTGIMAAPRIDEPVAYVPGAKQGRGPLIFVVVAIAVVVIALVVTIIVTMH